MSVKDGQRLLCFWGKCLKKKVRKPNLLIDWSWDHDMCCLAIASIIYLFVCHSLKHWSASINVSINVFFMCILMILLENHSWKRQIFDSLSAPLRFFLLFLFGFLINR